MVNRAGAQSKNTHEVASIRGGPKFRESKGGARPQKVFTFPCGFMGYTSGGCPGVAKSLALKALVGRPVNEEGSSSWLRGKKEKIP
ncbi:hypothetical protein GCM10027590_48230 [Nocardiopsis nanhaiensis]